MKLNKSQAIEVRQAQITIGDIPVNCYRDDKTRKYFLSQRGVSHTIDLSLNTTVHERIPKDLKTLLGNSFTTVHGVFTNSTGAKSFINLIAIDDATIIWFYYSTKGNTKAQLINLALLKESLERKCDIAFGLTKTELQYNQNTQIFIEEKSLLRLREELTIAHGGFQAKCINLRFCARHVHDYATKQLVGRTATESINQVPINPEFIEYEKYSKEFIGINHVNDDEIIFLERLINFKRYFSSKKPRINEDWKEYTDRVLTFI